MSLQPFHIRVMYKSIGNTPVHLETPLAPEPWQPVGSDHSANPSVKMENMQSHCKEWEEKDTASHFIFHYLTLN